MDSAALIPLLDRTGELVEHAIVDSDNVAHLSQWCWRLFRAQSSLLYATRGTAATGKMQAVMMHREIMGLPRVRNGEEVDHINGNGLDNRRSNLRVLSHAHNHQNRRSNSNSTSQFRGVYWNRQRQKWVAKGKLNGTNYHLGYFDSELQAARRAQDWRIANMPFTVETILPEVHA